jgi:hypothetical protein
MREGFGVEMRRTRPYGIRNKLNAHTFSGCEMLIGRIALERERRIVVVVAGLSPHGPPNRIDEICKEENADGDVGRSRPRRLEVMMGNLLPGGVVDQVERIALHVFIEVRDERSSFRVVLEGSLERYKELSRGIIIHSSRLFDAIRHGHLSQVQPLHEHEAEINDRERNEREQSAELLGLARILDCPRQFDGKQRNPTENASDQRTIANDVSQMRGDERGIGIDHLLAVARHELLWDGVHVLDRNRNHLTNDSERDNDTGCTRVPDTEQIRNEPMHRRNPHKTFGMKTQNVCVATTENMDILHDRIMVVIIDCEERKHSGPVDHVHEEDREEEPHNSNVGSSEKVTGVLDDIAGTVGRQPNSLVVEIGRPPTRLSPNASHDEEKNDRGSENRTREKHDTNRCLEEKTVTVIVVHLRLRHMANIQTLDQMHMLACELELTGTLVDGPREGSFRKNGLDTRGDAHEGCVNLLADDLAA